MLLFQSSKEASPSEKSEGKGQPQKVKFLCLNMKNNKATGPKSNFLAKFFCFLGPFWPYWVWAKNCLFFKDKISKIY